MVKDAQHRKPSDVFLLCSMTLLFVWISHLYPVAVQNSVKFCFDLGYLSLEGWTWLTKLFLNCICVSGIDFRKAAPAHVASAVWPHPFPKGKPRSSLPSQLLPGQQCCWKFNFSVSGEVSWWNKFNQLFLFSFGHTHAIIASFFQSVNLLWTHYFLRVSLKLWQLILRPSKAKTLFFVLFYFPKTWPVYPWVLRSINIG